MHNQRLNLFRPVRDAIDAIVASDIERPTLSRVSTVSLMAIVTAQDITVREELFSSDIDSWVQRAWE
jgi:hypothetical protein